MAFSQYALAAGDDEARQIAHDTYRNILLPPREWLGNPWRASRHAELVDWLVRTAPQADNVIVAAHMPVRTMPTRAGGSRKMEMAA